MGSIVQLALLLVYNLSRQQWAKTEFGLVKTLGGEEQAALFEQYVAQTVGHDNWVLRPSLNCVFGWRRCL
jgi:hypothetical protein